LRLDGREDALRGLLAVSSAVFEKLDLARLHLHEHFLNCAFYVCYISLQIAIAFIVPIVPVQKPHAGISLKHNDFVAQDGEIEPENIKSNPLVYRAGKD
jgi:hypothetical protein